jgi:hypothetical protein
LICVLACSLSVAVFGATEIAHSHMVNATAGITSDYFTPGFEARCIYGPGDCSTHSFTFISANEIYTTGHYVCAEIYYPSNHSPPAGGDCDLEFIRYCHGATHTAGAEHCIDTDANMFHVGGRNGGSAGIHIRRHGVY